jgi:hypothetical protein
MSIDNAQLEPAAGSSEIRVCPDCGEPAGNQAFCGSCGLNLSGVSRLPTRAEWQQGQVLKANVEAQQIATRLHSLPPLSPMRPASGPVDSTVVSAITSAVTGAMATEHRSNPVSVELAPGPDASQTNAVARIVLTNGALVKQGFTTLANANNARLRISVTGPPVLVSDGARHELTVERPASLAHAPKRSASGLSSADAAELAARRAHDAELEAKLHGWKPLPIWYTVWGILLAIGTITSFGNGQVGGGFVLLVLCGLCFKYVHYLYNGGRRRVWFVIW